MRFSSSVRDLSVIMSNMRDNVCRSKELSDYPVNLSESALSVARPSSRSLLSAYTAMFWASHPQACMTESDD